MIEEKVISQKFEELQGRSNKKMDYVSISEWSKILVSTKHVTALERIINPKP